MPSSRRVELSAQARTDVSDILQHSLTEWGADQRDRYGQALHDAFARLAEYPLSGTRVEHRSGDYRWIKVNEHVVYYRIVDGIPFVARVLHRNMSLEENL